MINIRLAEKEDLPQIKKICHMSWEGQGGDWTMENAFGIIGGKTWFEWFWPNIRKKFEPRPEFIWVAEYENEIAGFTSLSIDYETETGTIGYNAVDPRFRGFGIGKKQINFIMDIFRQKGMKYVEVYVTLNAGHSAARTIYEKVGCENVQSLLFHTAELRHMDLSGGSDAAFTCVEIAANDFSEEIFTRFYDSIATWYRPIVLERKFESCQKPEAWFTYFKEKMHDKSILLFHHGQVLVGMLLYSLDENREIGNIEWVFASENDLGLYRFQLKEAAKRMRHSEMKYLRVANIELPDGTRLIPPTIISDLKIDALLIKTEYKAMRISI